MLRWVDVVFRVLTVLVLLPTVFLAYLMYKSGKGYVFDYGLYLLTIVG